MELMREAMENRARMFGKTKAAYLQEMVDRSPQKRLIPVEEVVAVVLFLAAEVAAGITGQSLNVCGGSVLE